MPTSVWHSVYNICPQLCCKLLQILTNKCSDFLQTNQQKSEKIKSFHPQKRNMLLSVSNLCWQILHVNWVVDSVQQWCCWFLSWVIDLPPIFLFLYNSPFLISWATCWNSHTELTQTQLHIIIIHHCTIGEKFMVFVFLLTKQVWPLMESNQRNRKEYHKGQLKPLLQSTDM